MLADAAFGPVAREPLQVSPTEAAIERPPATAPLHRYVSLSSAEAPAPLGDRTGASTATASYGVTVYSDGLAEYEAAEDGTVFVTLLRAVGELSRADLPERPGHAGWPAATPEAQSPGPFEAEFAVSVHGADSPATRAGVERLADDVLLPLTGNTLRSALHAPDDAGTVELHGDGLTLAAIKPAECGEGWIVLRAVNATQTPVVGAWQVTRPAADSFIADSLGAEPLREAIRARLDETPVPFEPSSGLAVEQLPAVGTRIASRVAFAAGPREVVTILVR